MPEALRQHEDEEEEEKNDLEQKKAGLLLEDRRLLQIAEGEASSGFEAVKGALRFGSTAPSVVDQTRPLDPGSGVDDKKILVDSQIYHHGHHGYHFGYDRSGHFPDDMESAIETGDESHLVAADKNKQDDSLVDKKKEDVVVDKKKEDAVVEKEKEDVVPEAALKVKDDGAVAVGGKTASEGEAGGEPEGPVGAVFGSSSPHDVPHLETIEDHHLENAESEKLLALKKDTSRKVSKEDVNAVNKFAGPTATAKATAKGASASTKRTTGIHIKATTTSTTSTNSSASSRAHGDGSGIGQGRQGSKSSP
ncbi:unnamed protein product, partial [Amoebophrya sp. A25]